MTDSNELGAPPRIDVELLGERSGAADVGFLRLRRLRFRNTHADGTVSEPYDYDVVERDAIDAVGIVLEASSARGPTICLRSALRPPLALRSGYSVVDSAEPASPVVWEIPAGLVEPEESGEEGLRACAARETLEEVGIEIAPSAFGRLGPAVALSPGVIGEKLHFLLACVDSAARGAPTEDGSAVERGAEVRFVALGEALRASRDGRIADVKTEVAIRRLAELRGIK